MIRWCAYCQTYQGEIAPFADFRLTHVMCVPCEDRGGLRADLPTEALHGVRAFHEELRARAQTGGAVDAVDLMARADALGIAPVDLAVGLLQPALYELGAAWAAGAVSIAAEHAFSGEVSQVVSWAVSRLPEDVRARRFAPSPDFLIVLADGNYHTVGPQLFELMLLARGLSTRLVLPGLPASEIVALARDIAPRTLGISVADASQVACVRDVCAGLEALPAERRPTVVVGGVAVKLGSAAVVLPGVAVCRDAHAMLEDLRAS